MTETTLIEQKDLRNQCADRIEVLEKVKSLFLIPKLDVMTTKQIADYYEVGIKAIQSLYLRNKEEIDSDGTTLKRLIDMKNLGFSKLKSPKKGISAFKIDENTTIEINNFGVKCFSKRAILRIGMLLRDSKIAQEVRTQLLNTFEHATDAQRTTEIFNEQELYMNLARAMADGTKQELIEASQAVFIYKNRHIAELQQHNEKLDQTITENQPKVEFAEAMVGNTNSAISIGEMAKLLHKDGFNIGQNRLFEFLRKIKALDDRNVPYQKYVNSGYFKVSETILHQFNPPIVKTTTRVTPKGQVFIHNKVKQHYKKVKKEEKV